MEPKDIENPQAESDFREQVRRENAEKEIEAELKESAHFYGGWKELRKVIDMLEENENEAAFERSQNDYDRPSANEQAEMMHRIQRDIK